MINASNTLLNRCKLDIKPCHNWGKEPVIKKEDFHVYDWEDDRIDKIMGYDCSYCVKLEVELGKMRLGQSITIMFVGENQKAAILAAVQRKRKDNSHYLSLLQVDTDKYRVTCIPKLSIN